MANIFWEIYGCPQDDKRNLESLLLQGWEPFAVTAYAGWAPDKIWLRRQKAVN